MGILKLKGDLASIEAPRPNVFVLPSRPIEPVKPKMPAKPELPQENKSYVKVFLGAIMAGVLIPISLAMLLPLMYAMFFIPFGWLMDFLTISARHGQSLEIFDKAYFIELVQYWLEVALKYGVVPGVIIGGCVAIPQFWKDSAADEVAHRKYKEELEEYNHKCSEESNNYNQKIRQFQADMTAYQNAEKQYHISIAEDSKCIQTETANNEKRRFFLTATLGDLEKRAEEAQRCLRDLYSRDIIFPKYRDFVMVCSLYEYICAERCSTLDGRDGAYNILEAEMRVDRIITQLDCVIAQLNAIRANQYELFTILQSNQRILADIERSNQQILQEIMQGNQKLDDIKSDKLSSYYEELERKERDYENRKDHFQ